MAILSVSSQHMTSSWAWIGLKDVDTALCRNWRWPDGTGIKYEHWASNQPNGVSLGKHGLFILKV